MCGIAAVFVKPGSRLPFDWPTIRKEAAKRGCHSYGKVTLGSKRIREVVAGKDLYNVDALSDVLSTVYHFRLETSGSRGASAIQPFLDKTTGFVFAHNGNSYSDEIDENTVRSVSDSAAVFKEALRRSKGNFALFANSAISILGRDRYAVLMTDGESVVAARRYQPLFIRKRDGVSGSIVITSKVPEHASYQFTMLKDGLSSVVLL